MYVVFRSDYSCSGNEDLAGMQSMTMGMSRWLPVHGGAYLGVEPYQWRSVGIGTKNCDWGRAGWQAMAANRIIATLMQNASREARKIEALANGGDELADFWPLTPIEVDETIWAAWQLHRPTHDDGFVMYFRRAQASGASFSAPWVGVDAGATYTLDYRYGYAIDHTDAAVKGSALLAGGSGALAITLAQPMSSLLIRYSKVAGD